MITRKILDLSKLFPVKFYAADDGGVAGAAVADADGGQGAAEHVDDSDAFNFEGLPPAAAKAAMENDPELLDLKDKKTAARAAKGTKGGKKPVEEEHEELEPHVEPKPGAKKPAVEPAAKVEGEELEFDFETAQLADDIIPGLKGEDLKKAGPAAAEAIAAHYEKASETETKLTEALATLKALREDPIIKAREQMKAAGKTEYTPRAISQAEVQSAFGLAQTALRKTDLQLSPDEELAVFNAIFPALKDGFESISKQDAEARYHETLNISHAKQQEENTFTKAMGIFLGMGKFNKDLSFTETDPAKLFVYKGKEGFQLNEDHPEADKVSKILMPVMEALGKAGFSYEQINKLSENLGEDAVYSLAAKKLGLPVAINASGVINNEAKKQVSKALKAFYKGSTDGLPADGGGRAVLGKRGKDNEHGIDMERILDDESYQDELIAKKPGDSAWRKTVYDTREKAARLRRQQPKK